MAPSAMALATAPSAIPAAAAPLGLLRSGFWTCCGAPETMPLENDPLAPLELIVPKPPEIICPGPLGGRPSLAAPTMAFRRPDPVPAPVTELSPGPPIDAPPSGPPAPRLGKPGPKFPPDPPKTCVCARHDDEDWLEELTVTWDTPPGTSPTGCVPCTGPCPGLPPWKFSDSWLEMLVIDCRFAPPAPNILPPKG